MPATERRRVQRTGSSSFIVTLPKDWVDAIGLKSGDYVIIEKHGDKLVIIPPAAEVAQLRAMIKVYPGIDIPQVFRMILGAYIAGYGTITVAFDPSIPELAKLVSEIKNMARIKLAGIEVVEETYNSVTFKVLLNLRELPLVSAIKRLHIIVNNMLQDCINLIRTSDVSFAHAVIQRDDEADRFHHMIVRELSMTLLDVRVQHELGITNIVETLSYRIIARNLERIADHAVNIAKRVLSAGGIKSIELVHDLIVKTVELFNKAMNSLYSLSRRDAEEVIYEAKQIVKDIEDALYGKVLSLPIDIKEKIAITLIYDSLRRITRYSNGIAESVLNIKAAKVSEIDVK
ncbi:MAG: PhoU domain-containing protein [Desulfurococcaceae archaeon]